MRTPTKKGVIYSFNGRVKLDKSRFGSTIRRTLVAFVVEWRRLVSGQEGVVFQFVHFFRPFSVDFGFFRTG